MTDADREMESFTRALTQRQFDALRDMPGANDMTAGERADFDHGWDLAGE